jgi:hypothetical protein
MKILRFVKLSEYFYFIQKNKSMKISRLYYPKGEELYYYAYTSNKNI